jgi:hypothetical protein
MPRERTSVYLGADLAAAVKASGVPLAELVRRGLTASSAPEEPVPAQSTALSDRQADRRVAGFTCRSHLSERELDRDVDHLGATSFRTLGGCRVCPSTRRLRLPGLPSCALGFRP